MTCAENLLNGGYVELTDVKMLRALPSVNGGYLYGLWHPEKGLLYVGVTQVNLKTRWTSHQHLEDAIALGGCRLYWTRCKHFPITKCERDAIQTLNPAWNLKGYSWVDKITLDDHREFAKKCRLISDGLWQIFSEVEYKRGRKAIRRIESLTEMLKNLCIELPCPYDAAHRQLCAPSKSGTPSSYLAPIEKLADELAALLAGRLPARVVDAAGRLHRAILLLRMHEE